MVLAGYAMDHSLPAITEGDARKLTHLNVAFGLIRDGRVHVDELRHLECLRDIRRFNPDLRISLSIGGWGAGGFSETARDAERRALFARTSVDLVDRYDLDGLDIDWEYPTRSDAGIVSDSEDRHTFTLLLAGLREEFDRRTHPRERLLTIAAGAGAYFVEGTELEVVQEYLDLVYLMTYDLRRHGGQTGHHTNLYSPAGDPTAMSADRAVQLFTEAGVPRGKIVIGGAFYSHQWTGVPAHNHGLGQTAGTLGGFGPSYRELANDVLDRNGFRRYWDDEAQAPFLYDGDTFITYDDPESLRLKAEYARRNGLAGVMFWEYGHDRNGELLDSLFLSLG
jgi:chitinase